MALLTTHAIQGENLDQSSRLQSGMESESERPEEPRRLPRRVIRGARRISDFELAVSVRFFTCGPAVGSGAWKSSLGNEL